MKYIKLFEDLHGNYKRYSTKDTDSDNVAIWYGIWIGNKLETKELVLIPKEEIIDDEDDEFKRWIYNGKRVFSEVLSNRLNLF